MKERTFYPVELICQYVGIVSLTSVVLLILKLYNPILALTTALIILLIILIVLTKRFSFKFNLIDSRFNKCFLVILLFALLLRLSPYQYVMGGQDQGTYVNIAHQYIRNGQMIYTDTFRSSLNESQKDLYDDYNYNLMPSINYLDRASSKYIMAFYPLHPVWLSIGESILGKDNSTFALTLFSLLSITAFYLLAYEISKKNKFLANTVAFLVAIAPSHVFFSRFPASEMVTIAFVGFSMYYLYKFMDNPAYRSYWNLALSTLMITCFYYTRMSSFMYLPLFMLLATVVITAFPKKTKKPILIYLGAITFMAVLSYIFYFKYNFDLFYLVYTGTIQKVTTSRTTIKIVGLILTTAFFLVTLNYFEKRHKLDRLKLVIAKYYKFLFLALAVLVIFLSLYFAKNIEFYKVGSPEIEMQRLWFVYNFDWEKLKYILVFAVGIHTSILFLLVYVLFPFIQKLDKDIEKRIVPVWLFVMWFLLINSLFGNTIRYQYYDLRYYFSEIIPYVILITVVILGSTLVTTKIKVIKIFCLCCFAAVTLYYLFFTYPLTYGKEMSQLDFYKDITNTVSPADLLLLYKGHTEEKPQKYIDNFSTFTMGPLKYYFDLNTFILSEPDYLSLPEIKSLIGNYKNVYLLSDKKLTDNTLKDERTIKNRYGYFNTAPGCSPHTYEFLPLESVKGINLPSFIKCMTPPTHYFVRYKDFYLYKVNK